MPFGRFCWRAVPRKACAAHSKSSRSSPLGKEVICCSGIEWHHLGWAMKIDVLTLFPGMFAGPLDESIIMRARRAGLLNLTIHNLRDYAHDRHKTVNARPF